MAWAYAEQVLPYAYVKPGVVYTLEAWAYTPNAAPCKVGLAGGGSNGSFDYPNLSFTSSTWEKKTSQITLPSGATWAVVYVNGTGSGSQECRFDDISLHVGDIVAPTPPPNISGSNLLENPGFEQDASNWLLNGSNPLITTSGHTGKAIQFTGWSWIQQKLSASELQPGKEYVLRGWMRSLQNEACLLGIEGATSSTTFEQSYTYRSPNWVEVYVRYSLPSDTAWAGAFIAGPSGCQFDDLVMGIVANTTSTTGTVGSGGGTITLGNASVIVPAGAVQESVEIRLEDLSAPPAPLPNEFLIAQVSDVTVVGSYQVSANAAYFLTPIQITLPVTPST